MGVVSTTFTVPCTSDRVVLAVQDTLDQLGWPVLEVSSSLVVAQGPPKNSFHSFDFPKVSSKLVEIDGGTRVDVSVSVVGMLLGKKYLTGIMGRFVNSISLRIQTESIAINPTVALGRGQGTSASGLPPENQARDRVQQLQDLKNLLDCGVLTREEFAVEKQRILSRD